MGKTENGMMIQTGSWGHPMYGYIQMTHYTY